MKYKIHFLAILFSFALSLPAAAQKTSKGLKTETKHLSKAVHKVVMQLNTGDTLAHKGLLTNIKNLKEAWGDSVLIEVVVHGAGIEMVTRGKATQEKGIQEMVGKGVHFVVCRNTMKQRNVTEDQIITNMGFVPSGVGEVILKQEQGWSYLKAGM
jgi:uncharacterized protein